MRNLFVCACGRVRGDLGLRLWFKYD